MRVVLDTNVLIAALLVRGTPPDKLYEAWRDGRFELASCERQLEEINRVSRRPYFKRRFAPGVVFTQIDFEALDDAAVRRQFVGAARATMKLTLVVSEVAAKVLLGRL